MRVALINGSPKIKDSASESVLEVIKTALLEQKVMVKQYHFQTPYLSTEVMEQLIHQDCLVFIFPLYVDGIPSHLLSCLMQLEEYIKDHASQEMHIYALVNCGFYEGHQNHLAIEMMKNWTAKTGLVWGQALGVGAGGMMPMLKTIPLGKGPMKNLGKVLPKFIYTIINKESKKTIYTTVNFPRLLYKIGGEIGWRKSAKANGLKTKDLFTQAK